MLIRIAIHDQPFNSKSHESKRLTIIMALSVKVKRAVLVKRRSRIIKRKTII